MSNFAVKFLIKYFMKTRLLLSLLLLITLTNCKKDNKKTIEPDSTKDEVVFNIKDGENCFKEVIENKVTNDGKETIEINELIINFTVKGTTVSGEFNYIPFNEKAYEGDFTGTIKDNIATTICVFNKTDDIKNEEVIFKIEVNKVSILGGKKEEINGVWKFVDVSEAFYMNEIPRVTCN